MIRHKASYNYFLTEEEPKGRAVRLARRAPNNPAQRIYRLTEFRKNALSNTHFLTLSPDIAFKHIQKCQSSAILQK
eukprot:2538837-Amphidinium_carterae.1